MKRFWSAMNRFWFSPEEPLNLGICRGLWFGFLAWEFRRADFGAWSTVPDFFWRPIWAFDAEWIRPAPVAVMVVLQIVWKVSLATSCAGFCTRTSTSLATILSFYLFGITQCFGKINHDTAVVPLISLILAASRCGDAFSIDALRSKVTFPPSPEYRWPIRTVWVLLSLVFLAAGIAKLRSAGSDWVRGEQLATTMLARFVQPNRRPDSRIGVWLARSPAICSTLAAGTIAIECTLVLALLHRWLRVVLVPAALVMLLAFPLLVGPFFRPLCWAFVFWVPWGSFCKRWLRADARPANAS